MPENSFLQTLAMHPGVAFGVLAALLLLPGTTNMSRQAQLKTFKAFASLILFNPKKSHKLFIDAATTWRISAICAQNTIAYNRERGISVSPISEFFLWRRRDNGNLCNLLADLVPR